MKILVAIDGTSSSEPVLRELTERVWPEGSEVRILSIVHPRPWFHDPFGVGAAIYVQSRQAEESRAARDLEQVADRVHQRAADLRVSTAMPEGSPGARIVEEAERWGADLVLVGTHGYNLGQRLLHGSVSREVAAHAPCSVEIVRIGAPSGAAARQ